jgi:Ssp1 endopeptidase immunity protein Rap1a
VWTGRKEATVMGRKGLTIVTLTLILFLPKVLWGLTGNEWNTLSPASKQGYVWGVYDAWSNLHSLDIEVSKEEGNPILSRLVKCTIDKRMTYGETSAIVEKYMRDHPEKWHYTMASLMWDAVDDACKNP